MNKIIVRHKSIHEGSIKKHYSDAEIIDVTSKAPEPWVKFSPFFPHGNIPVPFSEDVFSQSVEGAWQGLKVFETSDVDASKFEVTAMRGIKRSVNRFGQCLGHRKGVNGDDLLSYKDARYQIYLPVYLWLLENCLQTEVEMIREIAQQKRVVLLDYETNGSVENLRKPLSHASLVIKYIENKWPN